MTNLFQKMKILILIFESEKIQQIHLYINFLNERA